MNDRLLEQLKTLNPWWQEGIGGIKKYNDPDYHRELYNRVFNTFQNTDQIISIVGMRQVGKSTIMRQVIRKLLDDKVDPWRVLYVSFDDHYLQTHYENKEIFDLVIKTYEQAIVKSELTHSSEVCFLFLDEINQLENWEKILKSYYDKHLPVRYFVTGSSAVLMKKRNRESLLGRVVEHILMPFSFKEYLEYHFYTAPEKDKRLLGYINELRSARENFLRNLDLKIFFENTKSIFDEMSLWYKNVINRHLQKYIIDSGFPRAWQQEGDFLYRQKFLWEQHVGKVLFADLIQTVAIRRPKDLEVLFARIIDLVGQEMVISNLREQLRMNAVTLDRYINYLRDLSLVFRLEKTKSKRIAPKRRSTNVKFYLTDVAIRNAFYKKSDNVFFEPEEMSVIAENLVCIVLYNFLLLNPIIEEQLGFYRERQEEIDFILKLGEKVLPIEVKWRGNVPKLKAIEKLKKKWDISESLLISKDFEMSYKNSQLSIPLWFFLLGF